MKRSVDLYSGNTNPNFDFVRNKRRNKIVFELRRNS